MRFTTLTEEKKLEWAYQNSRVKLKRYAKRGGCRSLAEYLRLFEKFDRKFQTQEHTTHQRTHPKSHHKH